MNTEFFNHKLAYGILIVGLVGLVLLFLGVWPNIWQQRAVALAIALFYTTWGTLTHLKYRQITIRVFYEYIGVGVLGGLVLLAVTL